MEMIISLTADAGSGIIEIKKTYCDGCNILLFVEWFYENGAVEYISYGDDCKC